MTNIMKVMLVLDYEKNPLAPMGVPGLRMLDPLLGPQSTPAEFFRHTWVEGGVCECTLGRPWGVPKFVFTLNLRKQIIPKIVDTTFRCNTHGQRMHFARTNYSFVPNISWRLSIKNYRFRGSTGTLC